VTILGQHVHFVVELLQQLLADIGVEHLLHRHLQLEVPPFVDCAEPAHRDLLPDLQISQTQGQHTVH
jgi:hypothetical protein